jgi:hypothetical protein
LLNDPQPKEFPNSKIAAIPAAGSFIKGGMVKIRRDAFVQEIEYADWSRPSISREGASAEVVERQKLAEQRLRPLMDGFHQLQGSNFKEVKVTPTLCGGFIT